MAGKRIAIRRKRYGARKPGGGKRVSSFRRPRGYSRKGFRSLRSSRGGKGLRNTRPTPNSIAKDNLITKLVDFEQVVKTCSYGVNGIQVFDCTPRQDVMLNIFGAAFAFNGTPATWASPNLGANGTYGANAKVAIEGVRKDQYINLSNEKMDVTVYRIKCRNHLTFAQTGGRSIAQIDAFIQGLLNVTTTKQVNGTTLTTGNQGVIGTTPYDSPTFCSAFQVVKRTVFNLGPNQIKRRSFKSRARLYTGQDAQVYSIMKGALLDIWYFKGQLGKIVATSSTNVGLITTGPVELGCLTRWDYSYVPENRTNVAVDKYILNQVPNDANNAVTAGTNDAYHYHIADNTLVSALPRSV
jgi:hypothetical protein